MDHEGERRCAEMCTHGSIDWIRCDGMESVEIVERRERTMLQESGCREEVGWEGSSSGKREEDARPVIRAEYAPECEFHGCDFDWEVRRSGRREKCLCRWLFVVS